MRILHFSDIHMSSVTDETVVQRIVNALQSYEDDYSTSLMPDVVVITGDYTNSADPQQFAKAREVLKSLKKELSIEHFLFCAGNHDVCWKDHNGNPITGDGKYENYNSFILSCVNEGIKTNAQNPTTQNPTIRSSLREALKRYLIDYYYYEGELYSVLIVGMNSDQLESEERSGQGFFGQEQRNACKRLFDVYKRYTKAACKKLIILTAFHHHVLPVVSEEGDTIKDKDNFTLTLDARSVLDFLQENGVHLVMHGHQHQESLVRWRNEMEDGNHAVCVSSVGTMCSDAPKNDFAVYDVNEERILVYHFCTSDESNRNIMRLPKKFSPRRIGISNQLPQIDHDRILSFVEQYDRWIEKANYLGKLTISNLVKKLIYSIAEDGSVPYVLDTKKRYRTSCLATVLECLYDIRLLPQEDVKAMQRKLLLLRDSFIPNPEDNTDDKVEKNKEDSAA